MRRSLQADHGADVANISYNVSSNSTVSTAAQYMRNLGGIVVVAAGNDGTDPGWSDSPALISVAGTNSSDAKASWSANSPTQPRFQLNIRPQRHPVRLSDPITGVNLLTTPLLSFFEVL
jgi:hypothetical protein